MGVRSPLRTLTSCGPLHVGGRNNFEIFARNEDYSYAITLHLTEMSGVSRGFCV
jgi:hypothetical protein